MLENCPRIKLMFTKRTALQNPKPSNHRLGQFPSKYESRVFQPVNWCRQNVTIRINSNTSNLQFVALQVLNNWSCLYVPNQNTSVHATRYQASLWEILRWCQPCYRSHKASVTHKSFGDKITTYFPLWCSPNPHWLISWASCNSAIHIGTKASYLEVSPKEFIRKSISKYTEM